MAVRRLSDDDIDVAVLFVELRSAQPDPVGSLVDAGLEVELVAVPRAHDVGHALVIGLRPDSTVVGDRLAHALVDPALADRALPVRALVVPGHEPPVDLEHAHLDAVTRHDPAVAVVELVGAAHEVRLRHVRSVILWLPCIARRISVATIGEAGGSFQLLLELDVGRFDHGGPSLDLGMHLRRELVRAATNAGAREILQTRLEIVRRCDPPGRRLELLDDRHRVATGAIRANQVPATTSGTPASASVGTSGRTGMREGTVTASARRLPVATCGTAAGVSTKAKAVCPLSRLVMDSLLLRYEMAVPGAPVLSLKCSIGSVNTGDGVG